MLSDEEKQAIKELTEIKELFEEDLKENYEVTAILNQIDLESLVIALNLIEKQQKEIEELKEKNKLLQENYSSAHEDINWFCENYISKDKIKAKIGEYEKQIEKDRKEIKESVLRSVVISDKEERIQELQSLLEKE